MTASAAPVRWWCSSCNDDLHLENTLWKSADGDAWCNASAGDVIAEQYAAAGVGRSDHRERTMHMPKSSWVHPALQENPMLRFTYECEDTA